MNIQASPAPAQAPARSAAESGGLPGFGLNTAPASASSATGNVGFSDQNAFDRAWDSNWVPPVLPKPRPPMHALQLAGNSELVRQVNDLLYAEKPNPSDILSLMDLMSSKIMELSIDGELQSVKQRQTRIEANQKEREKEFQVAKEKAIEADKNKEWSKFWGMLKAIGSLVLAAAVTAAGVMTGNPLMAGYGLYMMVNATMDVVDAVRSYQGKEPIGWRLSVGELAGWLAKQMGADEKTQAIVNAATEVVFGVVMAVATMGMSTASGGVQWTNAMAKLGMAINGVASIVKGISTIKNAQTKYEQAEVKAKLDRLQILLDVLQQQMERSNELLKVLQETMLAIWDSAAERLKMNNEAQQRVWGGGRRSMV